jgi:hypothetical protein
MYEYYVTMDICFSKISEKGGNLAYEQSCDQPFCFLSWRVITRTRPDPSTLKNQEGHAAHEAVIIKKKYDTYNWIRGIIFFAHDPWNTRILRKSHVRCPGCVGLGWLTLIPLQGPKFILNLQGQIGIQRYNAFKRLAQILTKNE